MNEFAQIIEEDNVEVFLNLEEFGEEHTLNGQKIVAVMQDEAIGNSGLSDSVHGAEADWYGYRASLTFRKKDVNEIPVFEQAVDVDGLLFLVARTSEEMGLITLTLVANER